MPRREREQDPPVDACCGPRLKRVPLDKSLGESSRPTPVPSELTRAVRGASVHDGLGRLKLLTPHATHDLRLEPVERDFMVRMRCIEAACADRGSRGGPDGPHTLALNRGGTLVDLRTGRMAAGQGELRHRFCRALAREPTRRPRGQGHRPRPRRRADDLEARGRGPDDAPGCVEVKFYGAFALKRRVDLLRLLPPRRARERERRQVT